MNDLTNQTFGRLTALRPTDKRCSGHIVWLCRCDCGNMCNISASNLRQGVTRSCGCLQKERARETSVIHGKYKAPEYIAWQGMKSRCLNLKGKRYKDWGGRGITICERWMKFENFFADMGKRPDGLTLDRTNNDGNYEPSNCRWTTVKEQNNNKRDYKYTR